MTSPTIPIPGTMPGARKAAIFLMGLGDPLSADLLRQFDPDEIRSITAEISALDAVAPDQMLGVFREFESLTETGHLFARGGADFARRLVEQALGPDSAQKLLNAALPQPGKPRPKHELLEDSDPQQLAQFLKSENPQTVALVLSNLSAPRAGALMGALPGELQPQVALRMASLESVSPEVFERITEAIGTKLRAVRRVTRSEGLRSLAALLNHLDAAVAEGILTRVDEENQAVGASVRDLMFVFDDITTVDPEGMKVLLGKLDRKVLTTALKGTSAEIRSHFTGCMSQRAAEMLAEDMEALGPIRIRDVSAAQQLVATTVRQLQQSGEIPVGRGGNEYVL